MIKQMPRKRLIIWLSIAIVGVLGIIIALTYAYFSARIINNSTPFQVHGGVIDLNISDNASNDTLLPVRDNNIDSSSNVFKDTFTITRSNNSDAIDTCYSIGIKIDEIGGNAKNRFVKYRLKQGNNVLSMGNFYNINTGDTIELLPNQNLSTSNTTGNTYELTIWLSYDSTENEAFIYEGEASTRILKAHVEASARNKECTLTNNTVSLNVVNGTANKTIMTGSDNLISYIIPNEGYSVFGAQVNCNNSTSQLDFHDLTLTNITQNDICNVTLTTSPYEEVEYIESTGTQYIDTGISGNNINLRILTTYEPSNNSQMAIFSARTSSGSGLSFWTDGYTHFGNSSTQISGINSTGKHNVELSKSGLYFDNNKMSFTAGSNMSESNLIIFRVLNDSRTYSGKIFDFKIYDNENIIRYFIPAKRKSDNKPGMYDTVNRVFYVNQGTGEDFITGPEVN